MYGKKEAVKMRRLTPEERYKYNVRNQQKALEDFVTHEIEYADDLISWYKITKKEIPDNEYRACAYFMNKEYLNKPGSLTLLYTAYQEYLNGLPEVTKENAFDILCYRYRMYASLLKNGGYDGRTDW